MSKKKGLTIAGVFLLGVIGGSALMYNDSVYRSVNDALGGNATQNAVGSIDSSNMDIQTLMNQVSNDRQNLLNQKLTDQVKEVQQRNAQIAKLNAALNAVNAELSRIASGGISSSYQAPSSLTSALSAAGVSATIASKSDLDSLVVTLKGMIDSESNSQQLDMEKLQSTSNKYNEALDTMTNMINKMQDSRDSIIGNMR